MKYIVAVIQPDRLEEVLQRLEEKEIHLVTVTSVMGRGRQKGISAVYRSHKEGGSLLKKVKLEIAVNDEFAKVTVDAIIQGALADHCHKTGPRLASPEDYRAMLLDSL